MDLTSIKNHSSIIIVLDLAVLLGASVIAGQATDVMIYFALVSIPVLVPASGVGITIYRKHLFKFQKAAFLWFAIFSGIYAFTSLLFLSGAGLEGASWVVAILVFIGIPLNFLVVIILAVVGELLTSRSKKGPPPSSAALYLGVMRIRNNVYRLFFLITILWFLGCETKDQEISFEENLSKTWKSDCLVKDDGYYKKEVLRFEEKFLVSEEWYSDANCVLFVQSLSPREHSYTIGNILTTDDGLEAREFDSLREYGDHFTRETILNIIYIDGNKLYFGIPNEYYTRPLSIDFENAYYKR